MYLVISFCMCNDGKSQIGSGHTKTGGAIALYVKDNVTVDDTSLNYLNKSTDIIETQWGILDYDHAKSLIIYNIYRQCEVRSWFKVQYSQSQDLIPDLGSDLKLYFCWSFQDYTYPGWSTSLIKKMLGIRKGKRVTVTPPPPPLTLLNP